MTPQEIEANAPQGATHYFMTTKVTSQFILMVTLNTTIASITLGCQRPPTTVF